MQIKTKYHVFSFHRPLGGNRKRSGISVGRWKWKVTSIILQFQDQNL